MSEVSLKIFYNYGRLPLKIFCGTRVTWTMLNHDRTWVKIEDGYHCKVCGEKLEGTRKLFCSNKCEYFFESNYRQVKTWEDFRWQVLNKDNGVCQKCGIVIATRNSTERFENASDFICDHIIPLCKGGRDWWEDVLMTNFQSLCLKCNKLKTAHDMAKPKVMKARYNLQKIQYLGWVFEKNVAVDHPLEKFLTE